MHRLYQVVGLLLVPASLWPFWRGLEALGQKDYLGTLIALAIGVVIARTGVDLARIGLLGQPDDQGDA